VLHSKGSSRQLVSMITGLICKDIFLKIQSNGAGTLFNLSFGMQQVRPTAVDLFVRCQVRYRLRETGRHRRKYGHRF
jgi:hypothetical protein